MDASPQIQLPKEELNPHQKQEKELIDNSSFQTSYDHLSLIKPANSIHIDQVIIHNGDFICGLEFKFKIDGKVVREIQQGDGDPEFMETLTLGADEHIEFISCSFNKDGIHTMTIKTDRGQLLLAEGDIPESEYRASPNFSKTVDVNLADIGKSIVGFRSGFNENLEMLAVYCSERLDATEEQLQNTEPVLRTITFMK